MNKDISVIIPTFNREKLLPKAIESVLNQSIAPSEIIIIDDGSTDKTKQFCQSLKDKIHYIEQNNKGHAGPAGPAAARNTGIKAASGHLLAFLDSDDTWDKQKLKIQTKSMEENPEYLISHTQEIWHRRGRLLNQKKKHQKYGGFIFSKCLPLCAVGMSTVVARKELFEKNGFFDESFPCCEDYEFWLRISPKIPFHYIDEPLTVKNGGRDDQVSKIFATGMDQYRIQALCKMLDNKQILTMEQKAQAIKELIKKCRIYGNGCLKHGKIEEGQYYLSLIKKY